MKLFNLIVFSLAAKTLGHSINLNTWSHDDLTQFLRDRNVDYGETKKDDGLVLLAQKELDKLQAHDKIIIDVNSEQNQHLLETAVKPGASIQDELPFHNWDYMFLEDDTGNPIKIQDWVFESWTLDTLKAFAKHNHVKLHGKNISKDEIIREIKSKFESICKGNKVSGNYPGDWLYSSWTVDDLRNWLKTFDIEFDPKESKELLIDKVRQVNYFASSSYTDSKNSLFESLHLVGKSVFDTAGKLKTDFYDSWSYSQLRELLFYNGILGAKPDEYIEDLTLENLKEYARDYEPSLTADIKHWLESASKKVDKFMNTSSSSIDPASGNFALGITSWSKERLKEFLKARGIEFGRFATRSKLIELVEQNKYTPILGSKAFSINWLGGSPSVNTLKNWFVETGQNVHGSGQQFLSSIEDYISQMSPETFTSQSKLYKPDLQQFKRYLSNNSKTNTREWKEWNEQAIDSAYQIAATYYDEASKSVGSAYDQSVDSIDDTLQDIQNAAFEYSNKFLDSYDKNKNNLDSQIESTKAAASEWANSIISTVNEKIEDSSKQVKSTTKTSYFRVWGFLQGVKNFILYRKIFVDDKLGEYSSRLQQEYRDQKKSTEEVISQGEKGVQHGKEKINHATEVAADILSNVGNQYSKMDKNVRSNAKEGVDAVKSAKEGAQSYVAEMVNSGSKSYDQYKKAADEVVKLVSSNMAEQVDGIPVSLSKGWYNFLDVFTNVDLISYLQSFGFQHDWLVTLNRRELKVLAKEQSKVFYGEKPVWDKSFKDFLTDTKKNVQYQLGLAKPSYWGRLKAFTAKSLWK
jgi:hypothetical protein